MHLWASQFWPVFWPGKITGSDPILSVSRFDFAVSLARRKGGQAKREKREAASIWPKQIQANTGLEKNFWRKTPARINLTFVQETKLTQFLQQLCCCQSYWEKGENKMGVYKKEEKWNGLVDPAASFWTWVASIRQKEVIWDKTKNCQFSKGFNSLNIWEQCLQKSLDD